MSYGKHCDNCGMEYTDGGNNFCSPTCFKRYRAKQFEKWAKTHTVWEMLRQRKTAPESTQYIKLDRNDRTKDTIRREYHNTPKLRDHLLAEHDKEISLREKELAGYKFSNKPIT